MSIQAQSALKLNGSKPNKIRLQIPKPHAAQKQILDNLRRFNVICAGRRTGKTQIALIRSLNFILKGQPVGWFSPTYKMMAESWRAAVDLYRPIITKANKSEHYFQTVTGGTFEMWSLDAPDAIRGRRYALALIDEAAMVPNLLDSWSAIIRPTLTDFRGGADFYSTPRGIDDFSRLYNRGLDPSLEEWASFQFSTAVNPYISKAEIEAARLELPDQIFRQEYLAEFVQGEGSVFRNIDNCIEHEAQEPSQHFNHRVIAGVDFAQSQDFTAISVGCAECAKELELMRFNQIDYALQRSRIKALFEKWQVKSALVELNSIGQPNFEELVKAGLPVEGFTTTAQSKPPLIQNLALALEKQEFLFVNDENGRRELEAYEAKRSASTGRISYGAPSGMHDDTVIARSLMVEMALNRGLGIWL
jgi:hypothetical protein